MGVSSGDPSLDKRMQALVIGMSSLGHPPLGKWLPLRVAESDRDDAEARADDGPSVPELDCEKIEQAPR